MLDGVESQPTPHRRQLQLELLQCFTAMEACTLARKHDGHIFSRHLYTGARLSCVTIHAFLSPRGIPLLSLLMGCKLCAPAVCQGPLRGAVNYTQELKCDCEYILKGHVLQVVFTCRRCQCKRNWSSSRVFVNHYFSEPVVKICYLYSAIGPVAILGFQKGKQQWYGIHSNIPGFSHHSLYTCTCS